MVRSQAETMRTADSDWLEATNGLVSLPTISTPILELVVRILATALEGSLLIRTHPAGGIPGLQREVYKRRLACEYSSTELPGRLSSPSSLRALKADFNP